MLSLNPHGIWMEYHISLLWLPQLDHNPWIILRLPMCTGFIKCLLSKHSSWSPLISDNSTPVHSGSESRWRPFSFEFRFSIYWEIRISTQGREIRLSASRMKSVITMVNKAGSPRILLLLLSLDLIPFGKQEPLGQHVPACLLTPCHFLFYQIQVR